MLKNFLFVGLGGFVGSIGRYYISKLDILPGLTTIPVKTLLANVIGSLLIGLLSGFFDKSTILTSELRLLLMTGFCGGFTTFSTFTNENMTMLKNGDFFNVFLYTGLSIFFGFVAVYLGYSVSKL